MAEYRREPIHALEQERLFENQEQTIVQAPNDIIPVCAVPEAGEKPNHKEVPIHAEAACAISAERNVDVFPEPCAQ